MLCTLALLALPLSPQHPELEALKKRFPSQEVAVVSGEEAARYVAWLRQRAAKAPNDRQLAALLADAERGYRAWVGLQIALATQDDEKDRLAALRNLRNLLTPEDFAAGRMPLWTVPAGKP